MKRIIAGIIILGIFAIVAYLFPILDFWKLVASFAFWRTLELNN